MENKQSAEEVIIECGWNTMKSTSINFVKYCMETYANQQNQELQRQVDELNNKVKDWELVTNHLKDKHTKLKEQLEISQLEAKDNLDHANVIRQEYKELKEALSQPKEEPKKEVDLDELRDEFDTWWRLKGYVSSTTITDWFTSRLPHLQKPVESDEDKINEEITSNMLCLLSKQYDDEETGIHFKSIMKAYRNKLEQFKQLKK